MNEMLTIQNLLDRLARNKRDSYQKFLERFRDQGKRVQQVMQRLIEAMNAKKANALSRLVKNKNEMRFNEYKERNDYKFEKMMKEGTARLLRDKFLDDMKTALDRLRENNNKLQRKEAREEAIKKHFLNQLLRKNQLLMNSTMDALRNHNNRANKDQQKQKDLLELMKKRNDILKRNILNGLRNNNNFENEEEERKKNILKNLLRGLGGANREKEKQSFRKLMGNKNLFDDQVKKLRDLIKGRKRNDDERCKKRAFKILKEFLKDQLADLKKNQNLKNLAIMLKNGLQRKLKYALLLLVAMKNQMKTKQDLEDRVKANILKKFLNNQNLAKRGAFQQLLDNKVEKAHQDEKKNDLIKKVLMGGAKVASNDIKSLLNKLRAN